MTARVTPVRRPGDHPDPAERDAEAELFAALFPGQTEPAFDDNHLAMAALAQNTALARLAGQFSGFLLLKTGWGQRAVECTAVIGFWTFWVIVINATRPAG